MFAPSTLWLRGIGSNILLQHQIYYIALCTYLFVASMVKASLTIFIMRIFPNRKATYRQSSNSAYLESCSIYNEVWVRNNLLSGCVLPQRRNSSDIAVQTSQVRLETSLRSIRLTEYEGPALIVLSRRSAILQIWCMQLLYTRECSCFWSMLF